MATTILSKRHTLGGRVERQMHMQIEGMTMLCASNTRYLLSRDSSVPWILEAWTKRSLILINTKGSVDR
jgi:hypothetical protein